MGDMPWALAGAPRLLLAGGSSQGGTSHERPGPGLHLSMTSNTRAPAIAPAWKVGSDGAAWPAQHCHFEDMMMAAQQRSNVAAVSTAGERARHECAGPTQREAPDDGSQQDCDDLRHRMGMKLSSCARHEHSEAARSSRHLAASVAASLHPRAAIVQRLLAGSTSASRQGQLALMRLQRGSKSC